MSLPRFNGAFKLQVSHSWLSPARLLGHLQMELSAGARNLVVSAPLWLCASVWHTRLQLLWALTISLTLLWGRKTTWDIGSGQRYVMICVTFLHVVPVKKTQTCKIARVTCQCFFWHVQCVTKSDTSGHCRTGRVFSKHSFKKVLHV